LKFDIIKKGVINKGILFIRGEKRKSIFLEKEGKSLKSKQKKSSNPASFSG
jgi:hypothetical protein